MRRYLGRIRGFLLEDVWRPVTGRRVKVLLVLLGFIVLFSRYVPAWNALWDYSVYYKASRDILNGNSPYVKPERLDLERPFAGLPYLYWPIFARFLTPLALMDYMWSSLAWVVLKCACLEICIFLVMGLLDLPFSAALFGLLHVLIMVYQPIGLDIGSGNVATLETVAILAGLLAWRKNRLFPAGALLVLPVIVKPTCLLVLLYPLHRRARAILLGAAYTAAGLAFCTAMDWRYALDLLRFLRSPLWARFWDELVQSYYNFSAVTVIQRIFGGTYFTDPLVSILWLPPLLIPLFPVTILLLTAWTIARCERATCPAQEVDHNLSITGPTYHSILSLVLLTTLLLTPRLAGYSLTWTVFPVASLAHTAIHEREWITGLLAILGFILIEIHIEPQHLAPGISQLLIDHYFWGLLFLYAANIRAATPPQLVSAS